jgi:hypothetical protein
MASHDHLIDGHERPWYIWPDPDNLVVSPQKSGASRIPVVGVKRRARGGRVPGSGQGTRSRSSDAGLTSRTIGPVSVRQGTSPSISPNINALFVSLGLCGGITGSQGTAAHQRRPLAGGAQSQPEIGTRQALISQSLCCVCVRGSGRSQISTSLNGGVRGPSPKAWPLPCQLWNVLVAPSDIRTHCSTTYQLSCFLSLSSHHSLVFSLMCIRVSFTRQFVLSFASQFIFF